MIAGLGSLYFAKESQVVSKPRFRTEDALLVRLTCRGPSSFQRHTSYRVMSNFHRESLFEKGELGLGAQRVEPLSLEKCRGVNLPWLAVPGIRADLDSFMCKRGLFCMTGIAIILFPVQPL